MEIKTNLGLLPKQMVEQQYPYPLDERQRFDP